MTPLLELAAPREMDLCFSVSGRSKPEKSSWLAGIGCGPKPLTIDSCGEAQQPLPLFLLFLLVKVDLSDSRQRHSGRGAELCRFATAPGRRFAPAWAPRHEATAGDVSPRTARNELFQQDGPIDLRGLFDASFRRSNWNHWAWQLGVNQNRRDLTDICAP